VKYIDATRESDLYIYVPGLRRITRIGGGNRCDCLGGFTHNLDDGYYWQGDNTLFNWKYVGTKEHLISSIVKLEEYAQTLPKGLHRNRVVLERRKVWVVEQTPKDPSYCYSKRIYYFDPESWYIVFSRMYDRAGKLWKCIDLDYTVQPNPESTGGGGTLANMGGGTHDLRIWESGPYYMQRQDINANLPANRFTLDAMRRRGR
jgi:hypothetical protein